MENNTEVVINHGDWDGMGGGWWIPMTIMTSVAPSPTNNVSRKSAQEILEIRLARGEIELDDYRQRLNALQSSKE